MLGSSQPDPGEGSHLFQSILLIDFNTVLFEEGTEFLFKRELTMMKLLTRDVNLLIRYGGRTDRKDRESCLPSEIRQLLVSVVGPRGGGFLDLPDTVGYRDRSSRVRKNMNVVRYATNRDLRTTERFQRPAEVRIHLIAKLQVGQIWVAQLRGEDNVDSDGGVGLRHWRSLAKGGCDPSPGSGYWVRPGPGVFDRLAILFDPSPGSRTAMRCAAKQARTEAPCPSPDGQRLGSARPLRIRGGTGPATHAGRATSTRAPVGLSPMAILPPRCSSNRRTKYSPMPKPLALVVPLSNRSKTRSRSSTGMPGP